MNPNPTGALCRPRSTRRGGWAPHIVVPLVIGAALAVLIIASTWQALRPSTPVTVRPVLFDRSAVVAVANQSGQGVGGVTVQAPGWVEADPYYIACSALTDGVVERISVLEGEWVEEGQVVAHLVAEDAELSLARRCAQLRIAEAGLAVANADLTAATTDWEHPVERERAVAAAIASLAETGAALAQLPALIKEQEAILERLKKELELTRGARDQGAAASLEVIILEQRTSGQHAAVEALNLREAVLRSQRERQSAEMQAAERNAELRVAERRALDVGRAAVMRQEGNVELERATVAEAELRLARMTIKSPIAGFVQRRLKVPGDKVMLGMDEAHSAHIIHLYDPANMQVRVDVPLADAALVSVGQRCEIIVDVLPDKRFQGDVTRITHEADLQKNTLQFKVRITDPSPLLRPEMLARVKFMNGGTPPADGDQGTMRQTGDDTTVIVDARCLTPDGLVWVVRNRRGETGRLHAVPVTVASSTDGWATVRGELHPGDLLAVGDDFTSGQHVRMQRDATDEGSHS